MVKAVTSVPVRPRRATTDPVMNWPAAYAASIAVSIVPSEATERPSSRSRVDLTTETGFRANAICLRESTCPLAAGAAASSTVGGDRCAAQLPGATTTLGESDSSAWLDCICSAHRSLLACCTLPRDARTGNKRVPPCLPPS
eukprot:5089830-Pleurochrysis_carterae.AAC.5